MKSSGSYSKKGSASGVDRGGGGGNFTKCLGGGHAMGNGAIQI